MDFLYWLSVLAGALAYGLFGLYVLIKLDQKWPEAFKVAMGSMAAFLLGWLLWPFSLLLVPFCHWMEKRPADDHSTN